MNDYTKLVAHAAAKFTGRPGVLSPLLVDYCGWENMKKRFSTEPAIEDFRIILSAGGLSFDELAIDLSLEEMKRPDDDKKRAEEKLEPTDYKEYKGLLEICMRHDSKTLGENNLKWSRDCTYKYDLSTTLGHMAHNMAAYWTDDDFLVIQARHLENPFAAASEVKGIEKSKLIPIEVIDALEPALNVPFAKQVLKAIKKKSVEVGSYISSATELPVANDVLSLLTCIRLTEEPEFDIEKLMAEVAAGTSSPTELEADPQASDASKKEEKK